MNKYIKRLIELGAVVGGKITNEYGFTTFERLQNEELEKIDEKDLGFATKAMGRAIFKIDENGKIINYKGVDSHLENDESASATLVGSSTLNISKDNQSYKDSTYPINFVIFQGKRPDIRIRGASPLEDLEIEAYINSRMQNNGIKLPQIKKVREFNQEFLKKYSLPIKIDGSFEEFSSDYTEENHKMKEYLKQNYGENYVEENSNGKRPEKLSEYFKRLKIDQNEDLVKLLENNNFSVDDFINSVDTSYSLGQRYGQTERIVENPFRIADIEYYTNKKDVETIENIIAFSEDIQKLDEPLENYIAKQMGKNLGYMMNSGWMCENYVHRQDYSLAGEMCDDSYVYLPDALEKDKKYSVGKCSAMQKQHKKLYFYQMYAISSTVKVLEDEMKLRGKSAEEIKQVEQDFISSFTNNLDLDKVTEFVGVPAKKVFTALVQTPTNYEKLIASRETKNGIQLNEEILYAYKGDNAFFDSISAGVAEKLEIKRNFLTQRNNEEVSNKDTEDYDDR
jgi:hypothetical protein